MTRPFPTIDDQVGQFLDTLLKRQAHRPARSLDEVADMAVDVAIGALTDWVFEGDNATVLDTIARRAVEGEQVEEHHPIIGKAA